MHPPRWQRQNQRRLWLRLHPKHRRRPHRFRCRSLPRQKKDCLAGSRPCLERPMHRHPLLCLLRLKTSKQRCPRPMRCAKTGRAKLEVNSGQTYAAGAQTGVAVTAGAALVEGAVRGWRQKADLRPGRTDAAGSAASAVLKPVLKAAVPSGKTGKSVLRAKFVVKFVVMAAAKSAVTTPAISSRAAKERDRFGKAVQTAAARAVTGQNAPNGLIAASALRAMRSSRIRHWPTRQPWLRPWEAKPPAFLARTGRQASQVGTVTAIRPTDAANRAMKPGLKLAVTTRPAKAGASGVNAAHEEVSALAVAMRAVVSATTASLHRP